MIFHLCFGVGMKPPRHHKGGWVRSKDLPRGPNGRALCRQCSTEVPKGRRTFCSKNCVDIWRVRTGSGAAAFLKKRDKGTCAICKLDCEALRRQRRRLYGADRRAFDLEHDIPSHRMRLWDIDHIVPVVEGGGSCGPDNLRTLCIPCHKAETRKLRERLAAKQEAEPE